MIRTRYHTSSINVRYNHASNSSARSKMCYKLLLHLAAAIRLHRTGARACSLRVVVYPLLLHKTFCEFGGGAFDICFNKIFREILFGHGGGVFVHRLTWFSRFLQSTGVNARFLWNQHILAIGRIVRVNVEVLIAYTHVHIYSTYDTTPTTNSSIAAACWWYTRSDYCCMLLLLLYDRLCVQIFTDYDVLRTYY